MTEGCVQVAVGWPGAQAAPASSCLRPAPAASRLPATGFGSGCLPLGASHPLVAASLGVATPFQVDGMPLPGVGRGCSLPDADAWLVADLLEDERFILVHVLRMLLTLYQLPCDRAADSQ